MNEKDGGPAFPFEYEDAQFGKMAHTGMTLRDWFAGQALQGMLANDKCVQDVGTVSRMAWTFSGAMLKAREEGGA